MVPARVSEKAPKVEDKQLRDYELVVIISTEAMDKDSATTIDKVSQLITRKGGIISDVEQWGKRKLAYPIRHFMEGYYVLSRFRLEPASCNELEANLRLSEEILRHLLIKLSN